MAVHPTRRTKLAHGADNRKKQNQMFHDYSSKKWEHGRDRDTRGGSSLVRNWCAGANRALARRNRLERELAQERAWWWNGWRMPKLKREAITCCVFERNKRPRNSIRERRTDQIDLRRRGLQILFLLRIFSFADYVTKRARMRAVKGLRYRLA